MDNLVGSELRNTFRSFNKRNFRLYFFGQLVSLSGTWMQSLAQSWLVYRITHSAWMLGVLSFVNLIPVLLLGLAGGSFADRFDRRTILLVTQSIAMVQAVVLAWLTLSGQVQIWQIAILAAVLGACASFEMPARQAFIVSMVDREDLVNAMSLNASLFHASRTLGPAAAGILVGMVGEGVCFAVNAASYLAALVAIYFISVEPPAKAAPGEAAKVRVGDAIKFAFETPHVRNVILLASTASLFGMQYLVMMPVVASEVLHMKAGALGALMAGASIGSCTAALILASRATGDLLKRGVGYASLGFSISLFAFSLSSNFYLSLALTVPMGFFITSQMSGSHSLLQLAVSDSLRGRISSIWMINMLGLLPLGSLAIGWVESRSVVQVALSGCAVACALAAVVYLLKRSD